MAQKQRNILQLMPLKFLFKIRPPFSRQSNLGSAIKNNENARRKKKKKLENERNLPQNCSSQKDGIPHSF